MLSDWQNFEDPDLYYKTEEPRISVFGIVRRLREQRLMMVKTLE